jgi:hypothetical protein
MQLRRRIGPAAEFFLVLLEFMVDLWLPADIAFGLANRADQRQNNNG